MARGLSDVTVVIDIQKPVGRLGFGKPLILGAKTGGFDYKEYSELSAIKADFPITTEEYKAAAAIFAQGDNAPAVVAITCRNTSATAETIEERLEKVIDEDWYFLIFTSTVAADVMLIADAIELDGTHQFMAHLTDKAELASIFAKKYTRTTVMYHPTEASYPEAAWVGAVGSAPVGSVTWKFKQLKGIVPLSISATELAAIHALGANTYVTKAGDDVTSEGKVVSGEYIDIIHAKDYVTFSIEYAVQKLMNTSPKVPYTAGGIAMIESAVNTVLQRANNQGMIASDNDGIGLYGTVFKPREDVDPADRADRVYNSGSFFFELAGAIHEAKIKGTITF